VLAARLVLVEVMPRVDWVAGSNSGSKLSESRSHRKHV